MFALAVTLSVVGLLVGPLVFMWASRHALMAPALDGLTLGVIPALLLARILPHLVEECGVAAVVAFFIGYLGLLALEASSHGRANRVGFAVVLPSLALHSFLDGTALAVAYAGAVSSAASTTLAAALVAHKIPEGLFLATRFLPALGARATFVRIAALAAMTVLGAVSGRELLGHVPDAALHLLVAFGLGAMLRMIVHRHEHEPLGKRERAITGVAFLAGVVPLFVVPSPVHLLTRAQPHELSVLHALVPLFVESAPWLFVALLPGALLRARLPRPEEPSRAKPAGWAATLALTALLFPWRVVLVVGFAAALVTCARPRSLAAAWVEVSPPAAQVLPAYAVGVGLAVVLEAALPANVLSSTGPWLLALLVVIAPLLAVAPAGACVVAAVLVHKGASPAAGVAFILAAIPAAEPHRRAAVLLLALGGALATALLGRASSPASIHQLGAHVHSPIELVAAALLLAWMVVEIVRQGPRSWFHAATSPLAAQFFSSIPRSCSGGNS